MKLKETPKNIKAVLKKLNKNESEVATLCIDTIAKNLRELGVSDAKVWTTTILPAVIHDFNLVEDTGQMEELINSLDGVERVVVESVYDAFHELKEEAKNVDAADIKETLIYSLSKTLDGIDKEKYKRLYG